MRKARLVGKTGGPHKPLCGGINAASIMPETGIHRWQSFGLARGLLMAREYGQIRHDMWSDDDWRSLTREAQHLYMMLLSDPKLDYCGVTTWHPGKLAQRSSETTGADILIAGAELSNRFFIVIDEDTEEVMIRSYLRHDPIMKHPKLSVTVTKDFAVVASKKLRAVIVHELLRLKRENPDWPTWEHASVRTVLRQNAVSAKDMSTDLPQGAAHYLGLGQGIVQPNGLGVGLPLVQPDANPKATETVTRGLQQEREPTQATGTTSDEVAPRKRALPALQLAHLPRGFQAGASA